MYINLYVIQKVSAFGRKMVGFLFNYEFQITNYEFFSYSTIFTIRFWSENSRILVHY